MGAPMPQKKELPKHVVMIASSGFFSTRGKKMEVEGVFSPETADALVAKYPDTSFIVCIHPSADPGFAEGFAQYPALRPFKIKKGAAGETTLRLKALLQDLGVRFKPIRNARAVSYLNISSFTAKPMTVYMHDDYEKAGIEPDKKQTFTDMSKKRRAAAWP